MQDKLKKQKSLATVRAVIPADIKDKAVLILDDLGLTQSDVILQLFTYIADYAESPFEVKNKVVKR